MINKNDYINCAECPYCRPQEGGYKGIRGHGVKYGICHHGGNLVFLEPWKEKRRKGTGYIHHDISGCGLYKKSDLEG